MNWFKGSIAEAVTISKQKNATFVVYVEGKDENSAKLSGFLDQPLIKEKLEKDCFVAIKIEGGSEAYMQFASIYQIVPLPSLFFIGKNGTPLEIATGIIASTNELDKKIENVLRLTGKSSNSSAASASAAFISGEQKVSTEAPSTSAEAKKEEIPVEDETMSEQPEPQKIDDTPSPSELPAPIPDTQPTAPVEAETPSASSENKELCADAICFQKPIYPQSDMEEISTNPAPTSSPAVSAPIAAVPTPPATPPETTVTSLPPEPIPTPPTPITTPPTPAPTPTTESTPPLPASQEDNPSKVEQAKQLIEERRKLKQAEEDRQERERELNRRKDGKTTQNFQQWQKEEDFKELKESIRRDRMEDKAARQRILEQIASDRAERAQKFTPPPAPPTPSTQPTTPTTSNPPSNFETSRIQFRIPNGETNTQTFESSDTFATVRAYVKGEVIKGTGIKDFTLATTFPKHEFTVEDDTQTLLALGLCPNAVILVITKASSGPSAVVARSGGIVNIFNTIFWALLSPVMAVFGYVRNFIIGRNDRPAAPEPRPTNSGTQKRANEERIDPNDLAKKRNLDRFLLTKDGPSTSKEAIATANSTGGAYRRVGGSNIHRLSDQHKDSDDENNTWNGNSTQQQ